MSRLHAHGQTVCVYDSLVNTGSLPGFLRVSLHCTDKGLVTNPHGGVRLLTLFSVLGGQYPSSTQAAAHHAQFRLRKDDLLGFSLGLEGEAAAAFLSRCIHTFFPSDPTFQGISLAQMNAQGNLSFTLPSLAGCPELQGLPFLGEDPFYVQVTVWTPGTTVAEGYRYLTERQFPLLPPSAVHEAAS